MRVSNFGLAAVALVLPALAAVYGCGSSAHTNLGGSGSDAGGGTFGGDDGGGFGGSSGGNFGDASLGSGSDAGAPGSGTARGTVTAPDCPGCTFPQPNAPSCGGSAPAINIIYPNDGVLVPPNMNTISVQWTPFGASFKEFEVDFENSVSDLRIITKCTTQTMDTGQPPAPSGGCEYILTQAAWTLLANANRGLSPITVTVRGTTDGMCASTSANSIQMSMSTEDVVGALYYWKSTVSSNGTGGQIWVKTFGDTVPEAQVTGVGNNTSLSQSCNGCHVLSRDGLRMVVYSDDDDSDDEYGDVTGSLIDMTNKSDIGNNNYVGRGTGQDPGFSTFSPDHTYYLTSNGLPNNPTNTFGLWGGNTGNNMSTVTLGAAGDRPTMPDWSPDGKSVIYVLPKSVGSWDGNGRNDDAHMFGGSLYTAAYMGNQQFGAPALFLMSNGENNYYPSYSPDGQFVLFDRAPNDTSVTGIDGCKGNAPQVLCPNDSFSNPAARLMLVNNAPNGNPTDLQRANGSPASAPVPLSNSWPRWSPFVQNYQGQRLLWITFSSTRDYGIRVKNHKSGMYQCYPPDAYELPMGSHHGSFDPLCQQPQLWMAAINLSEAVGQDPSHVAFWLPFQDITTHNHTPQWTQQTAKAPPAMCVAQGGSCTSNAGACCAGTSCSGANGQCVGVPR
jgi:hypothetical protein